MKNTKKYGAISKRDYIDEDDNISANYVNSRIPNDEEIKTNTVTKSSFLCNCNYIQSWENLRCRKSFRWFSLTGDINKLRPPNVDVFIISYLF